MESAAVSMLDVHAEALEGGSGPYHEFLLSYKASRPVVYGFVEGREDPSFYRGFIEQVLPAGWSVRLIRSGNRKAVLAVLATMPWDRFAPRRICFFIDRDLSDLLPEAATTADKLYVTDNYSIENDVVNSHVLERVLEEVFGVTGLDDTEREAVTELFESNLAEFCEALTPIMAQVLIWRRVGTRACLDNIKPGQMWSFSDAKLCLRDEYKQAASRVAYAAEAVKLSPSIDEELRAAELDFRAGSGLKRFVRGKYLLWLFAESAAAFHAAIPKFCARHTTPPKARVTLGAGNAMSIIGPRAKAPASLVEFLNRNYVAYAAETVRV
jgi:hypothetical protein